MRKALTLYQLLYVFIFSTQVCSYEHTYQIFVSPYWPLAVCSTSDATLTFDSVSSLTSEQKKIISGYEVQLLIQNIKNIQDSNSYQISMKCVNSYEMISSLSNNPSTISNTVMGIGAQRYSKGMLDSFIIPSMPIFQSSLKLVNKKVHLKSYWAVFQPLNLEVVLGYVLLGIAVSLIVWLMEEKHFNRPKVHHMYNYLEVMYDVFSSLFFTNLIHLRKISSRIVLWFFWFTTFIFGGLYQANLTQKISESYTINEISSLSEGLNQHQKIGVLDVYKEKITQLYPTYISNFQFYSSSNTTTSILQMFNEMDDSTIDGLLLETPLSDYFTSLYCSTEMVDGMIWSFNYVSLFGKNSDAGIISLFNSNLSKSKQTLPLNTIKSEIFDVTGLTTCQPAKEQITDTELVGLWIILVSTFCLTLLIWKLQRFFKWNQGNYISYYQKFQNQKNELFELKLKQAIKEEVKKILKENQDKFLKHIENFEKTLMLQEVEDKNQEIKNPQQPPSTSFLPIVNSSQQELPVISKRLIPIKTE